MGKKLTKKQRDQMEKLAAIKAEGNCKTKEEQIAGLAKKFSSFDNKNSRTESVFKSRFQPKIEILIKDQEETEILSHEPC